MIQHGDVAMGSGGKVTNLSTFTGLLDNFNHHKSGSVQITSYTSEGGPIYTELSSNGNVIHYASDDSQDRFGGKKKGRKTPTCTRVLSSSATAYRISRCENLNMPSQILMVPPKH